MIELEAIPNVALTTDIIVGYPNETEEQFEETLSLYDEVQFEHAYTYLYSQRDGTPAAKMKDNVPTEVKKINLQRLNKKLVNIQKKQCNIMKDKLLLFYVKEQVKKMKQF